MPFLVIEELRRAQKEEQAKNKPSGFEFERKLMPGHNISEVCKPHRPTKAVEAEKSVAILENILKSVGKETRSVENPSFLNGQSYTELSYIINGAEKLKEMKPQTPLPVFFDPGAGFKRKLEPKLIVKGNSTERLVGRSKSKESTSKVGVDPAGNLEFKKGYKISSRAVDSGIAIKIGNGKVPEETNLESLKIVKKASDQDQSQRKSPHKKPVVSSIYANHMQSGPSPTATQPLASSRSKAAQQSHPQVLGLGSEPPSKLLINSNLLGLVKKNNLYGSRQSELAPFVNGGGGQALVMTSSSKNSAANLKSQIITKLIKKPSETQLTTKDSKDRLAGDLILGGGLTHVPGHSGGGSLVSSISHQFHHQNQPSSGTFSVNHLTSLSSISSGLKYLPQSSVHSNSVENRRFGGSTGRPVSKIGPKKSTKQGSPEKDPIVLAFHRKPEWGSLVEPSQHVRSASKKASKVSQPAAPARGGRRLQTERPMGFDSEIHSNTTTAIKHSVGGSSGLKSSRIYHSKNLSDFNITNRVALGKGAESARSNTNTKKGMQKSTKVTASTNVGSY